MAEECCCACGNAIEVMVQKGTGFCSQKCAKNRRFSGQHLYRGGSEKFAACEVMILRDGLPDPCGLSIKNPIHLEVKVDAPPVAPPGVFSDTDSNAYTSSTDSNAYAPDTDDDEPGHGYWEAGDY
jgi:hypothetical protein